MSTALASNVVLSASTVPSASITLPRCRLERAARWPFSV